MDFELLMFCDAPAFDAMDHSMVVGGRDRSYWAWALNRRSVSVSVNHGIAIAAMAPTGN